MSSGLTAPQRGLPACWQPGRHVLWGLQQGIWIGVLPYPTFKPVAEQKQGRGSPAPPRAPRWRPLLEAHRQPRTQAPGPVAAACASVPGRGGVLGLSVTGAKHFPYTIRDAANHLHSPQVRRAPQVPHSSSQHIGTEKQALCSHVETLTILTARRAEGPRENGRSRRGDSGSHPKIRHLCSSLRSATPP